MNGRTALSLAARNGNLQILSYLLKNGADYRIKDCQGNTPMHYAAAYGFAECLSELNKAGCDQNFYNIQHLTPLGVAWAKNHYSIVKLILSFPDTDVNFKDNEGKTLLIYSLIKFKLESWDYIKYLVEKKNAIVTEEDQLKRTALHYVVQLSAKRYKKTIIQYSQMPKRKRKEYKQNYRGTILDLVKLFIRNGASINAPDSLGVTPFMTAIKERQTDLIKYFLDYCGPNLGVTDGSDKNLLHIMIDNRSYLHHKRNEFFIDILKKLEKDQISGVDEQGYTPLVYMIKEFTTSTTQLYNKNLQQILENAQLAKMEEYLQNIDPNQLTQNNQNIFQQNLLEDQQKHCQDDYQDEIDQEEDRSPNYRRNAQIKMTAQSSSFAGQAPIPQGLLGRELTQVAPQFQGGLIRQQIEIRTYGQFQFNIGNNQTKILGFTYEEYKQFQDQAMIATKNKEEKVIYLFKLFLDCGASLDEYVKKNKLLRKHNPKRVVTENHYNSERKKQIQHYIFQNFPNKQFLQNLQIQFEYVKLDFNKKSKYGQTPLHLFCLNQGNQNIYDSSGALTIRQEFLKYILQNEFNVDIKIQDNLSRTPTHILAVNFEEPLLDLLIAKGGNLNIVSKENVVPLIHHINRNDFLTVNKLIAKKADPNFQDLKRRSSLHHAINISSLSTDVSFDMEDLLLKEGAKADIEDMFGRTPLYYCFIKIGGEHERSPIDPRQMVKKLVTQQRGCGKGLDSFNRSPVHYAAMRDSVCSVKEILKYTSFSWDKKDNDKNTPLGLAFLCDHQNFVQYMIDYGAKISKYAFYKDFNKRVYEEDKLVQYISKGNKFSLEFCFIPVANNIKPDNYTYFKLAITNGWQNIAFQLIDEGFSLFAALQDSVQSQQFQLFKKILSRARVDQVKEKKNSQGQNLFHLFAQFGLSAQEQIYEQILQLMERNQIPLDAKDKCNRTPLHYAARTGFDNLLYYLLDKRLSPNDLDYKNNTPYSYALQRDYQSVLNKFHFPIWLAAGLDIKSKFNVNEKNYQLDTFMYLIQEKQVEDELQLDALLQKGSDINSLNQDGETALFLSLRANNETLFKFLLDKTKEARITRHTNIKKETIFHVVVQPLPYGSYENTFMLKELINAFIFGSVNSTDNYGRSALDYALRQKTGNMAAILKNNYGKELIKVNLIPPAIETARYPDQFQPFEEHAKEYIKENQNTSEEVKSIIDPRLEVDPYVKQKAGKYEVLVENGQPYSLIMTKVDLANGLASENICFKMQIIHKTNKDVYILFTRWGSIGTPGQLQIIPYDKPNAIKKFHSIFKSKSGNIWEKIIAGKPFSKQPKKYFLQKNSIKQNYEQLMQPFDFSITNKHPYPQHHLEKNVARFLLQFCQVQLYKRELQQIRVDHEFLPLESLEQDQLQRAKNLLKELEEFALKLERERNEHRLNDERLFELFASINEKSKRYYEIIPCIDYRTEPLSPLETLLQIRSQSMIVETLLNFGLTSKILLGALNQAQQENPLTYCFKSIQIRVQTLRKEQPEYQMIETYAKVTSGVKISNIFAVERRNETERFNARFANLSKQLLWYGSKTSNYMAILAQGLKIALPWAYASGSTFGKGIYFTDTFEKSYQYTQDYSPNSTKQGGFAIINKIQFMMMKIRMISKDIDIYFCVKLLQGI